MITTTYFYDFFHNNLLQASYIALGVTIYILLSLFKAAIFMLAKYKKFKNAILIALFSNLLTIASFIAIFFFKIEITTSFVAFYGLSFGFVVLIDTLLITIFKGKSNWFSGFLASMLYNLLIFSGISVLFLFSLLQ